MNPLSSAIERITNRKLVTRLREAVRAHSDAYSDACEERDRLRVALDEIEFQLLVGPELRCTKALVVLGIIQKAKQ